MNLSIEQFEYIEAYLQGQLSEEKKQVFEASLDLDAELKKEVETQRQLRLGLQVIGVQKRLKEAHQRYLDNLDDTEKQEEEGNNVRPLSQPKTRQISWTNWAVAASIALVMSFGWLYKTQYYLSSEVIVFAAEQERKLAIDFRGEANTVDKQKLTIEKAQWLMALVKIKTKDKKEAKRLLTKIAETDGHSFQEDAKTLLYKM
ncbi:anti-sigma factor [Dyadobacter psychrotolerans]|uniref:Uncharacterized protein n=1 Tax=Dyadobacter psychrotolerans TaxID=2541721 RepID=A0A4R5DDE8_9BACT|nr:hypothetical protein [Dyadobacter psychrotolerans]TDE08293.1 hypothetical protein E0F88_32860 [Dyadobacter psychrotolerans]